jgi:hypothetical protein
MHYPISINYLCNFGVLVHKKLEIKIYHKSVGSNKYQTFKNLPFNYIMEMQKLSMSMT